ncbi:MAG TPA: carboxypeptidase regulatory-like domain-containing protein [Candidatus Acidoferrum sp.]|nr:carboxypeptidase regulatory-like domain-containing protein [Candidatus Acidoferrum sp.]
MSGTVVDASGAVASGVGISIKNMATGNTTKAATNGVGFYIAPNLPAGDYEITVSATGFATQVRSGITLTVGQQLLLNLTLKVGSATDSVTVTSEAPTVNLVNSTLGGVTDSKTIEEIPLIDRSWTALAALEPGVHFVQDQPPINAPDRVKRGLGLQLTVAGGRPQQNNYLLDGVNINDYANAGPGSILGGNLGTDAVAEFSVVTSNYSTEYGRTSGGVISAITKSGTNQFHGNAYEFARNSAFDARNFFDKANIPPFSRNQYGASIGGPIRRDKTFIFGDYEGVKQTLGQTLTANVPSPGAIAGNFLPAGTPDPAAVRFLNAFFPPADPATISGDTGQFTLTSTQKTLENFFIVRADHIFSEKNRIFATFMFDKASQSIPDEFGNKLYQNPTRRDVVAIEENHIFTPQLLNSFRVGLNVDNVQSPSGATAINPKTKDTSLGFIPGETAGAVSIGPLTTFSGGLITATPFKFDYRSWQAYDNLFYNKGIHSMKFGANIEWIQANSFAPDSPGGAFTYNSLLDFLTNAAPALFKADSPGSVTPRGVRQWILGAYFQDDVHLRPNLTFNWGVRYEMASIITEVDGKLSNLRVLNSALPNPKPQQGLGSPFMQNPTKLNFEPRLGFAWDPFKDGKTSVRGGVGIYDLLPLRVEMAPGVDGVFPFQHTLTNVGNLLANDFVLGSSTPAGAFADPAVAGSQIFYVLQFNPHRNYVAQWNFNIQRQIAPNTTAMIGYVGSRGVHMWIQSDGANMVLPTQTPQGLLWPCSTPLVPTPSFQGGIVNNCLTQGVNPSAGINVINPAMGRTQMATFNGDYFYDGLLTQIKKTMSHGLQVEASYTWAKSIDTGSGSAASDQYRNSISTLLPFCKPCRRGLSDTDIRHTLTANYVWNIPTPASFGAPAKAILGNWEAGGILTMETGTPFTVTIPGDPLGMSNGDSFQFPDRIFGPGCSTGVNPGNPNQYVKLQCFAPPIISTLKGNEGRNTLTGPGLVDLDVSLSKSIPIKRVSETSRAQFRVDFFNIINRANFTSPNDNRGIMDQLGNPVSFGGAITLTNTPSRQLQFSVKFSW